MIIDNAQLRTFCVIAHRALLGYSAAPDCDEEREDWIEAIVSSVLNTCQDLGATFGNEGEYAEDVIRAIAETVVH